jgi:serine kinase of HPr protein (carbohydrate metabolism regulator)
MQTYHGTVVDVAGRGVMLRGPSGSGKSDLALRLIDRGAVLVADDQILLEHRRLGVFAVAPLSLYGLLEVRGLGIQSIPAIRQTMLHLIVELCHKEDVPRLPEQEFEIISGHKVAVLRLNAFEETTAIKVEYAVNNVLRIGSIGHSNE